MDKVLFYLKDYALLMLPYLAIFVPLYLLARGCWLVRRNQPMNFQRATDVDDLILNTLGMLCGYFLGNGYGRLVRRKREKEQDSSHGKVKGEE